MICPHCEYSHKEFDYDTNKYSVGKEGDFYRLLGTLERSAGWFVAERATLKGCPSCKKTFICLESKK
jgi:hypothetical protein